MSTCRGAAAPHEDCPHGDRCDWEPSDAAKVLTTLAMLGRGVPSALPPTNRAQRRAAARRKR
jgi:hypothetical protein